MCIFLRFCFIVVDDVCSGSVSMFMVKLLLWKIVCFCLRGGIGFVFRLCSGCCASSVCCRNCEACSCRWSLIGSVVVSAWRCCMFVSCVHPVTVLKAVFCTICNLLVLVCEMIGDHIVFAYSIIGSVIVLYVTSYIMSHITKILLKVLDGRLKRKVDEHVDEEQYGFRKGKGTRNAIFVLRTIIERSIEKQLALYICFVDFEKAFDTVKHDCLIEVMKKYGIDQADIRMMAELYWKQRAVVRVGEEVSEWINIKRGVRQGCVLSLTYFHCIRSS